MPAKGGDFERSFARALSLWWTHGESDSVFWRVNASGGRARVRAKTNRRTDNQYGDICAVEASGHPLMAKTVWELKRGYGKWSPFDELDRSGRMKDQPFLMFWKQLMQAVEDSGNPNTHPFMVWRRDQRAACIAMQTRTGLFIRNHVKGQGNPPPVHAFLLTSTVKVVLMPLAVFFEWCPPEVFK